MRPIAPGVLLAALLVSAGAFSATPASAGDYGYGGYGYGGYGGDRHVSYRSTCCYRKLTKKITRYQRVYRDDYSYRPRSRDYSYGGGYYTTSYPTYSEPYRYSYRPYRSYRSYEYDDYRPRYRSYRPRYDDRPYGYYED
jgi:hypothetical protein